MLRLWSMSRSGQLCTKWTEVVAGLGLAGLHFHDLRHAGNIWASKAGMSTRDLMARPVMPIARSPMRSKMVTEHRTGQAKADESQQGDDHDGAAGALVPVG
jgi:hypothetical protein